MSPPMRRCIAFCVAGVLTVALGCVPAALAQSPKKKVTKTEAKKEPGRQEVMADKGSSRRAPC